MATPTPSLDFITPTTTPTVTPTPSNKPCIKPPKISFVDGNASLLAGKNCCCPDMVKIRCEYLHVGKRYTAKIVNQGPALGRIFPRSISFVAKKRTEEFDFFSQFVCDADQQYPLANTRYLLNIVKPSNISLSDLDIKVLNLKIGSVKLEDSQYVLRTYDSSIVIDFNNILVPKQSQTLAFSISITGNGIISTSKQVSIGSVGFVNDYINLVSIDNPPPSIGVIKTQITQNNTGTDQDITISIPSTEKKPEQATISIPQGTKFFNEEGEKLEGQLNVVIAQFSPLETESLDSFPGGFFVSNALDINRSPINEDFYFHSAGFLSMEVSDESGRSASLLSQNINIRAEIDERVLNSDNDFSPISEGDSIPLWSISADGVWKEEGAVTVSRDQNNKLYSNFNTSHLTTYNFDWKAGSCSSTSINLRDYVPAANLNRTIYFDMYTDSTADGSNTINNRFRLNPGVISDNILTLTRYPNLPIRITFYADAQRLQQIGQVQITSCGTGPSTPVTPSPTPSSTRIPVTPTVTPTITNTPSLTPTNTPTRSATPTPTPTVTVTPSFTPTQTPLPIGSSDS